MYHEQQAAYITVVSPNLVLFPGETTRLYIFEERYKQLVEECIENDASFGIPFFDKGIVQEFGSEVKINRILKSYENGAMDILVESVALFRVLEYTSVLKPKLYGAGLVESIHSSLRIQMPALQDATVNYFHTVQNKMLDYDTVARLNVFAVASALQLTNNEKYSLLASANPQFNLLNLLKFITHIINTENQLKDRFINN